MRKLSNHTCRLTCLILVLAGLLGCLARPDYSLSRQLTYHAAVPLAANPSWVATGSLNTLRSLHSATLLPNGQVLIAGGRGYACSGNFCYIPVFETAELYDPTTETWRATGSLNASREWHTATLLPSGKVLVAGGGNGSALLPTLNSAELYDPATGTWSATGNLNIARSGHTATLLPNGKVLIAAGWDGPSTVNSAELYDPAIGTWSSTGAPSPISRKYVATLHTLLPNGKVLAVSGNFAELYDPAAGQWIPTSPPRDLVNPHTATLLANGQVLVTGQVEDRPHSATFSELYNPATGEWSMTTPLGFVRRIDWLETATLLTNGQVLVTYNSAISGSDRGAQLYDPATGTWSLTGTPNASRGSHTATLLPNGKVLVAGGISENDYDALIIAELFDLGLPTSGIVTSVSAASFGLMGLASEAIAAGFGAGLATTSIEATTHPLPTELGGTTVKLKDSNGAERFAPLFSVSPTQVNYQIPAGTSAGAAEVTITSGDGTVSTGVALIHAVAPSLFTVNADGRGVAAAVALRVRADGSQLYEPIAQFDPAQNKFVPLPLDLGPEGDRVFLIVFGTGIRFRSSLSAVIATIGGAYAQVSFAEAQPDLVGADQVNVLVPRSVAGRGEVDVLLTVDAAMANPVRINVK